MCVTFYTLNGMSLASHSRDDLSWRMYGRLALYLLSPRVAYIFFSSLAAAIRRLSVFARAISPTHSTAKYAVAYRSRRRGIGVWQRTATREMSRGIICSGGNGASLRVARSRARKNDRLLIKHSSARESRGSGRDSAFPLCTS